MRILKIYEDILNISATEMYADLDEVVMLKLKETTENKCKENSFITKIIKIEQRSMLRISKSRTDGSGDINVKYLAEAVIYNAGDILPLCKIIRIEKSHKILCLYNHTMIWIHGSKRLQNLRLDQVIPVIIKNADYRRRSQIVADCALYFYSSELIFYIASTGSDEIMADELEMLRKFLLRLRTEKVKFEESSAGSRKFLADTFYPYTHTKKWDEVTKKKFQSIEKIVDDVLAGKHFEKNIIMSRVLIEKSTDDVLVLDNIAEVEPLARLLPQTPKKYTEVYESPTRILLAMMSDYLKFMKMIRKLATHFPDEKSLTSQSDVWNIYHSARIPLNL